MPSFTIDTDSDFNSAAFDVKPSTCVARTLLLAPPSIASHEENLRKALQYHDRSVTDLQMLDRLSAGLVDLPHATYGLVIILTDADGTRTESAQLLGRNVFGSIAEALKAGGKLQAQDGTFGQDTSSAEHTEAILAGLVTEGGSMIKPEYIASQAVPLRLLRRKDKPAAVSDAGAAVATAAVQLNGHGTRNSAKGSENKPFGVGFVDFGDDFGEPMIIGEDSDDELIDEDELLTEEDMKRPVNIPAECVPRIGKRRRACKDCTCGLAERIAKEDADKRNTADVQLKSLKLEADDLAEVDFTVQGKVGSCGNCSLGDAFRCDGCPYIGMPAFKPGEEVRLLNNDVQL